MENEWELYILRCGDGTLYTGIARDADKRLAMHRSGKGAKYTRGRGPLTLCYREICPGHGTALRREYAVKQLTREEGAADKKRLPIETGSRRTREISKSAW